MMENKRQQTCFKKHRSQTLHAYVSLQTSAGKVSVNCMDATQC